MSIETFSAGKYEGCRPGELNTEELHSVVRHDHTIDDKQMARSELQRRLRTVWQRRQYEQAIRPRRRG